MLIGPAERRGVKLRPLSASPSSANSEFSFASLVRICCCKVLDTSSGHSELESLDQTTMKQKQHQGQTWWVVQIILIINGYCRFLFVCSRKKHIKNIKALSEKDTNMEKHGWCYSINQWYRREWSHIRPALCIAEINIIYIIYILYNQYRIEHVWSQFINKWDTFVFVTPT